MAELDALDETRGTDRVLSASGGDYLRFFHGEEDVGQAGTTPAVGTPGLRAAMVLVVALLLAACLAGCGSGKSTSSPTTTVA